jgi:hypothetical protein
LPLIVSSLNFYTFEILKPIQLMKKLILLFFVILSYSIKSNAQNVPNGDFETWLSFGSGLTAYNRPDLWQTTDSFSTYLVTGPQHSVTWETSSVYHGTSAMKLTPFTHPLGFTVPGAASNGQINTTTIQIIGGTPDVVRHQTLSGWYQYSPVGGDVSSISVALFKRNGATRDTVAKGVFTPSAAVATYTQFQINLTYLSAIDPDSMLITIYGGPVALGAAHTGTVLLVDSLNFSGVVSGVNDIPAVLNSVRVYPVPASNDLTVSVDLKKNIQASFEIVDLNGKRVLIHNMNSNEEKIDISELNNGNYFYNLLDEKANKLSSGKFSVSK